MDIPALAFGLDVGFHNLEEAIWLPRWMARMRTGMPRLPPTVFRLAVLLITFLAMVPAIVLSIAPVVWIEGPLAGFAVAMALNAIVPHLALSLRTQSYMPGTATALSPVLPAAIFVIVDVLSSSAFGAGAILGWGLLVGASLLGILYTLTAIFHRD